MWGLGFPGSDDPFADQQPTPAQLHEFANTLVGEFHPAIKELIAESQPEYTMKVELAAPRPRDWRMSRVTLMGDAVHATPPVGAHDGNTALRDATKQLRRLTDSGPVQRWVLLRALPRFRRVTVP